MARVPKPSLSPGTIVADSYRIGERLGVGGMGEVFEAVHTDSGAPVAIKILRESASDIIVERFGREGQALAQMRCENVIRVFDVGVLASGRPYIVMERLHGADLHVVMKQRGVLPFDRAVEYILQACVGLAEAHGLGIVHRDLKPANLYLAELPDGRRLIKILDFGISKLNASSMGGRTALTEAGDVFGSPRYMPPEQLRDTRDVDVRADIWSLAVTLAELVLGQTPFHAEDFGTLMFNILDADPPPMTHVDPRRGAPFDAVIRKCLEKDRADRYQTIDAVADALAPLVADGAPQSQRVRAMLSDAKSRAGKLDARAAPQVTRIEEPAAAGQTTAIVRIALAPIEPFPLQAPAASAASPVRKGVPTAVWLVAVALVGAGAYAAGTSSSSTEDTDPVADEAGAEEEDDSNAKKKKRKKKKNNNTSKPAPTAKQRPSLAPNLANKPSYRIAVEIGGLLKQSHEGPVLVRDMIFFEDRAVLVVAAGEGAVRYDYRNGKLGDPVPYKVMSGARRSERIPLDKLALEQIAQIASESSVIFGDGKLNSVSIQWLSDETLWVASSVDGESARYHLDGRRRDP